MGLNGKVGLYGRSIGGITACHLAAKFSDSF
jgi:predicted acyl esterase